MKVLALILFFTGIMLRYLVKRRKFNRRSYNGIEGFKCYESAWFTGLVEKLAFWLGTLMAVGGTVIYFII